MRNKFFYILILVLSFGLSSVSAQTPKPKTINGGVINGKAESLPKPEYPAAAAAVKASGEVKVQVTIDEEGGIISASAVSGHPLLRQAAEQAARQATFKPTTLSGQPVKVTGVIVYNFVPSPNSSSNEEKLLMMGLGTFLAVSSFIPSEEWDVLKKEDLAEASRIAKELEPLTLITRETSVEKRAEIIDGVITALENKLSGADAWQFRFGKEFAALILEAGKAGESADGLLNEQAVKTNLVALRDSMLAAPADFPPDVMSNLKKLVELADAPNLNSDENKFRLRQIISETLETISPDFTDN